MQLRFGRSRPQHRCGGGQGRRGTRAVVTRMTHCSSVVTREKLLPPSHIQTNRHHTPALTPPERGVSQPSPPSNSREKGVQRPHLSEPYARPQDINWIILTILVASARAVTADQGRLARATMT